MNPASEFSGPLLGLGFGGVLGFVVGYAAKKVSKIIAFVAGGLVILMVVLQYMGWITVNWGAVEEGTKPLMVDPQGVTIVDRAWEVLVANIPFGGGFIAGFAAGFKLG